MRHLTDEDYARLADEAPTADDAAHLSICADCRAEVAASREQLEMLSSMEALRAPEHGWPVLAARLRAEGLLNADRRSSRLALRIAASLVIFLAGAATGGAFRGSGAVQPPGLPAPAEISRIASVEEAERTLLQSEAAYIAALNRYSRLTQGDLTDDPVNRLAALEGIVLTSRAALEESPADPVINGYLLTALTQRDAMLRQISDAAESSAGSGDGWY